MKILQTEMKLFSNLVLLHLKNPVNQACSPAENKYFQRKNKSNATSIWKKSLMKWPDHTLYAEVYQLQSFAKAQEILHY